MSLPKKVLKADPLLGTDAELFIQKGDKIVGSEVCIPPEGLLVQDGIRAAQHSIVRDGVQAELHPAPFSCRASHANSLAMLFAHLHEHLSKVPDFKICFTPVVKLSQEELDGLSPEARVLGCQPSLNIYDERASINVPPNYPYRSAGGHVHVGYKGQLSCTLPDPKEIIQVMDILVGNTCVLIDRDPNAALRREVYGRAGEYRLPLYGVEYRTLSNFWLQAHQLWSLVGGLTKLSVGLVRTKYQGTYQRTGEKDHWGYHISAYVRDWDPVDELLKRVNPSAVQKAINTNDLALAQENWEGVKDFLTTYVPPHDCGIHGGNVKEFEHFAKVVQEKGFGAWFPEPLLGWLKLGDQHGRGWEAFSNTTLTKSLAATKRAVTNAA
jgi:hypothetical protein